MARKKKTENETQAESAVSTQPAADAQAASPADTETDGVMAETDPAFADQPPDSPIPAEAPATDAPAAADPAPAADPPPAEDHPAESAGLIRMVRDLEDGEPGPSEADVHPDEVANYEAGGWRVAE